MIFLEYIHNREMAAKKGKWKRVPLPFYVENPIECVII